MELLEIITQGGALLEVTVEEDSRVEVELVTAGLQGPPGQSAALNEFVAAQIVPGHRVVSIRGDGQAWLADRSSIDVLGTLGVANHAAAAGAVLVVTLNGPLTDPSFAWNPGLIWLGENGLLTQILPQAGELVIIGTAAGPQTIVINPRHEAQL